MMTESAIRLPVSLGGLQPLAYNVRCSWHPPTQALVERMDSALWEATGHNPVRMIAQLPAARLDALARDASFVTEMHRLAADLDSYVNSEDTWYARRHERADDKLI